MTQPLDDVTEESAMLEHATVDVAAPEEHAGAQRRSWLSWLVSDDPPGGAALNVTMLVILAGLLLAPFLFPGTKALGVASRICIFVILVASYDLMLGFTGIVSFAHTMFFGIGAYGVAIMLAKGWVGWGAVSAAVAVQGEGGHTSFFPARRGRSQFHC